MTILNQQALRENGCVLALDLKTRYNDGTNKTPDSTRYTDVKIWNPAKTVTVNGVYQVSPKVGEGCGYFDGVDDWITCGSASDVSFSGDFTVEGWIYLIKSDTYISLCSTASNGYYTDGFGCEIGSTRGICMCIMGSANTPVAFNQTLNTWHHWAMVRSGTGTNNVTFYWDGQAVSSYTNTSSITSTSGIIFNRFGLSSSGYMTNVYRDEHRVSNTARYTGSFTPPVAPFTADANTVLLLHMDSDFTDSSSTPKTVTNNGAIILRPPVRSLSGISGGVGYFNGSSDYLTVPAPAFSFTGDCCFELWFNRSNTENIILYNAWMVSGSSYCAAVEIISNTHIWSNMGVTLQAQSGFALTTNQWYHLVLQRTNSTIYLILDGTVIQTGTYNGTLTSNSYDLVVGKNNNSAANYFNGYLDEIRVSDTSRYAVGAIGTTNFTPPTTPFQPDANTKLLINFDGDISNAIIDRPGYVLTAHSAHDATINGDCVMHVGKDGQGLMYFDGSGDYISIPKSSEFDFGSGDFTIAFWAKFPVTITEADVIIMMSNSLDSIHASIEMYRDTNSKITLNCSYSGSGWDIPNSAWNTALSNDTWYFIVLKRTNGYLYGYINMVQDYSYNIGSNALCNVTSNWYIGLYKTTSQYALNAYLRVPIFFKGRALDLVTLTELMNATRPDYI